MNQPYNHLSIEHFYDLLKKWDNNRIKISKQEIKDIDETVLQLEGIEFEKRDPSIDGYEQINNLQLIGEGMVQTERNVPQPLPLNQYEIPIENDTLYGFDGTALIINTTCSTYKIELLDDVHEWNA